MDEAIADAEFIQESVPEDEILKRKVIETIDAVAGRDIVIASSTANFVPSGLQASCRYPDSVIVGHPFNPVYMLPLAEVVGGKLTASETIAWSVDFYRLWGAPIALPMGG